MSTPSSAMPAQFRRKKLLTRPTLKFQLGVPIYVKIEGPMFIGRDIKTRGPAAEGKKKEPATVLDVIDLMTGEESQIVCATIIKSTLSEEYPNDSYVGKSFELTKMAKEEGKDYNKYRMVELEDAEPAPVNKKEPKK